MGKPRGRPHKIAEPERDSARATLMRYVVDPALAAFAVRRFLTKEGAVDFVELTSAYKMTRLQLAETAGLPATTVSKADRRTGRKAQARMTEMVEILSRVEEWAGGEAQAMAWYRSQQIPALDGRTPEALVKSGRAGAVREYLDHLSLGGFA